MGLILNFRNLCLYWFLLVITTSLHTKAEIISSQNCTAVVELAIFCDVEYNRAFQNDSEQLEKYWSALVWDAHLKFQTVLGTNISFRLNSISVLQDSEQLEIIEKHRLSDRSLQADNILDSFRAWLHQKAIFDHFTKYDIAVLAVGSTLSTGSLLGMAEIGGACSWDIYQKTVKSALLFTSRHEDPTDTFAHEIAHLLNVPHDNETDYKEHNCEEFNATEHQFLMSPYKDHAIHQYRFSPCSIKSIINFLDGEKSSCLREVQKGLVPIIDTSLYCNVSKYIGSVSIEDQCKILLNDKSAYVTNDGHQCYNLKCHLDLDSGLFSKNVVFDPLEGSPCKEENSNGRCFMGSCVSHGGHLANFGTGMCLENTSPFESTNDVSMYHCLNGKSWTHLDLIRIEETENKTVHIKFLDLGYSSTQIEDKCLALSKERTQVIFEKCEPHKPEGLWNLRDLSESNHETKFRVFFLIHSLSEQCLTVSEESDASLKLANCTMNNTKQHWQYLKDSDMFQYLKCNKNSSVDTSTDAGETDNESYIYIDSELVTVALIIFIILLTYVLTNLVRDFMERV